MHSQHYNTTGERGLKLADYQRIAETQGQRILALFASNPLLRLSPSQVQERLDMGRSPLTSIRRAMTDLTTAGKLVKTGDRVDGPYGRPEHKWRLADRQGALNL